MRLDGLVNKYAFSANDATNYSFITYRYLARRGHGPVAPTYPSRAKTKAVEDQLLAANPQYRIGFIMQSKSLRRLITRKEQILLNYE